MIAIKRVYEHNRRMEKEMEDKREDIEKYLSDKSIPLKDRWENYTLLPESFAEKGYFTGFSEYDNPFDDFGMDRYEAYVSDGLKIVTQYFENIPEAVNFWISIKEQIVKEETEEGIIRDALLDYYSKSRDRYLEMYKSDIS